MKHVNQSSFAVFLHLFILHSKWIHIHLFKCDFLGVCWAEIKAWSVIVIVMRPLFYQVFTPCVSTDERFPEYGKVEFVFSYGPEKIKGKLMNVQYMCL